MGSTLRRPGRGADAMTGLYDDQGVLRCAGRDPDDCLAYAVCSTWLPGSSAW
jgi:hypothetical protein